MTDTPEQVETSLAPETNQTNTTPTDVEVVAEATAISRQSAEPGSILSIIQTALLNKADVETMRELLAIRREERADQAAEAFANALVMFRRLVKPIIMTGKRDDRPSGGKVHYAYAELTTTIEQIQPALDQCGLTPTWCMVKSERDWVEIECVVTHSLRHKETSKPLGAKPEGPSGQTDAQKRAGTITSLQRKTLFMALGLTTKEDDAHLKQQEQGGKPPKPASAEVLDPDVNAAKRQFAAVCLKLAQQNGLPPQVYEQLLVDCQQASGKQGIGECADWLAANAQVKKVDGVWKIVPNKQG